MLTTDISVIEREHRKFDVAIERWAAPKPFGISGMWRVKNEAQFLRASVLSHLRHLDQAVLVIQPSDDDTEAVARRLHEEYRDKVKLCYYPFPVHRVGSQEHLDSDPASVYTMMHLTNWAISQCDYSWIAKIEGDVIGLSTFAKIREAVDANPNKHLYYGRVGLNIAGPAFDHISFENPRNAGWDEAVFPNHPNFHCVKADKWESMNLHDDRSLLRNFGWSFLHVKRCKADAKQGIERWVHWDVDNMQRALREYNAKHPYPAPDNELGEDCLFETGWMNV